MEMTEKEFNIYLPTHLKFLEEKKKLILTIKKQATDRSIIKQADCLI